MSVPKEWKLEDMPPWAIEAARAALQTPPVRSALAYLSKPAWPLLVEAATVGTFLPRDLAPDAVPGDERQMAEKAVLDFAQTTYEPGGVKWSLTPQSRTEVLQQAMNTDVLKAAIDRTSAHFQDAVSGALRGCLSGHGAGVASLDLKGLEATRVAASWLAGVSEIELPGLDELDREIELRRLLAHFERMVGRRPGTNGKTEDRFFGRDVQLEQMRAYVGVISAGTLKGTFARAINRLSSALTARTPMMVYGAGGVGKTTLLARFMLEHAEKAASRYPFAYLDFDRSTVSARQRLGLLAEMCIQTSAQFSQLTEPMTKLAATVRQLARRLEIGREPETISLLTPHAREFRGHIDRLLGELESRFEFARPFLLVFDTLEIAQYNAADVAGLEQFVKCFSNEGESGMWPRLRLILSGRKKTETFLGTIKDLVEIGALDKDGSAELMLALARDAGKPIPRADADLLVEAVAKATGHRGKGIQPLRIRLIGELFQKMTQDGPSIVDSLMTELAKPLEAGGLAAQTLIDGLLVRRVLDHVNDLRVRALADPGLVVRRITPGVIKGVMTLGTAKPDAGGIKDDDESPAELWMVGDAEAKEIFEAFRKEVSLVEPDEGALRHRPDVRQQMLPLIRARRPRRFLALHRLAFDYFRHDRKDLKSAAEAIYHGLWANEPLAVLNDLWRDSSVFDPRIDADEFDEDSPARAFVLAKAGKDLSTANIAMLPREVALDWADVRSASLLGERLLVEAMPGIRAACGERYDGLDDRIVTAAMVVRLLYRAGSWDEANQLAWRHLSRPDAGQMQGDKPTPRGAALLSLLRTSATIRGKSGGKPELEVGIAEFIRSQADALSRAEVAAHAAFGLAQSSGAPETVEYCKMMVRDAAAQVSTDRWKDAPRTLRLVVLAGAKTPEYLTMWAESREHLPFDLEIPAIGGLIATTLGVEQPKDAAKVAELLAGSQGKAAADALGRLWRRGKAACLRDLREREEARSAFLMLAAFDHSDWARPIGNALTRALAGPSGPALKSYLDDVLSLPKTSAGPRASGMAIVDDAVDIGELLRLARSLAAAPTVFRQLGQRPEPECPRDVFALCAALLRWHAAIMDDFRPAAAAL